MGFLLKLLGFSTVGVVVVTLIATDPKAMAVAFGIGVIAILGKVLGK